VLVIAGAMDRVVGEEEIAEKVRALRASGMSARDASARAAAELGVSKRVAYRLARNGSGETEE
jgi:hypothetical protein